MHPVLQAVAWFLRSNDVRVRQHLITWRRLILISRHRVKCSGILPSREVWGRCCGGSPRAFRKRTCGGPWDVPGWLDGGGRRGVPWRRGAELGGLGSGWDGGLANLMREREWKRVEGRWHRRGGRRRHGNERRSGLGGGRRQPWVFMCDDRETGAQW